MIKVKKNNNFNNNSLIKKSFGIFKCKKIQNMTDLKEYKNRAVIRKKKRKDLKTSFAFDKFMNMKNAVLTDFDKKKYDYTNKSFFRQNDNNTFKNTTFNNIIKKIKINKINKSNINYNHNRILNNNFEIKLNKSPFYGKLLRSSIEPRKYQKLKMVFSDCKNESRNSNEHILSHKIEVKPFNIKTYSLLRKSLINKGSNRKTTCPLFNFKENSIIKRNIFKNEQKNNFINNNCCLIYKKKTTSSSNKDL